MPRLMLIQAQSKAGETIQSRLDMFWCTWCKAICLGKELGYFFIYVGEQQDGKVSENYGEEDVHPCLDTMQTPSH